MNIYVSVNCLSGRRDILEVLDIYRDHNIYKIEFGSWTRTAVIDTKKLIGKIHDDGIICQVHHYFPPDTTGLIINLASSNKVILDQSMKQMMNSLHFCRDAGGYIFTFHAGFCVDPKPDFSFPDVIAPGAYKTAFSIFIDSVGKINDEARSMGIKLGIENNVLSEKNFNKIGDRCLLMCEAHEFERLWDEIPSDNLGILIDLGHLKVTSNVLGFDKEDFIKRLKDKVFSIHLHDNDGNQDKHNSIKAGSWPIDIIKRKYFCDIPVVLEATGLTIEEIKMQLSIIESNDELERSFNDD